MIEISSSLDMKCSHLYHKKVRLKKISELEIVGFLWRTQYLCQILMVTQNFKILTAFRILILKTLSKKNKQIGVIVVDHVWNVRLLIQSGTKVYFLVAHRPRIIVDCCTTYLWIYLINAKTLLDCSIHFMPILER